MGDEDEKVDTVARILDEAGIEPRCPECNSRKFNVLYSSSFLIDLPNETSKGLCNSPEPYNISCFECDKTIWES